MDAGDPLLLSFHGTAAAYNKSLRKELLGMRSKRDLFLQSRRKILNPFLIEKVRPPRYLACLNARMNLVLTSIVSCDILQNYFVRKERLEQERRLEKKAQAKAASTSAAVPSATPNIYANTYYNTTAQSRAVGAPGAVPVGMTGLPSAPAVGSYGLPAGGAPQPFPFAAGTAPAWPQHPLAPISLSAASNGAATYLPYPPLDPLAMLPPAVQPIAAPVVAPVKEETVPASTYSSSSAPEPTPTVVEEEDVPEIDEKQLVYSTMEGVKLLSQPSILKAELHEHQVCAPPILVDLATSTHVYLPYKPPHQVQGISWMVHMFQNGMPMILGDQVRLRALFFMSFSCGVFQMLSYVAT